MHFHVKSKKRHSVSRLPGWWTRRDMTFPGLLAQASRGSTMDNRRLREPAREPEIRVELVARVRREIAEGLYETPEKLEIALQRLLDRLDARE